MKYVTFLILYLLISSPAIAVTVYGDQIDIQTLRDADGDGVINVRDACPETPERAAIDNVGCHEESTKLLSVELNILFDTGRYEVKPQYYKEVKKLADFLSNNRDSSAVIEGHTDSIGSEEYNKNLSQNRASAILDVIVDSFNINKDRVSAIGYGESKPIAPNTSTLGRSKNRRVVAEVFAQSTAKIERWDIYSVDRR